MDKKEIKKLFKRIERNSGLLKYIVMTKFGLTIN